MDDTTLHHLCKSLHAAEAAWRAASTTGAGDLTEISNALHTLHYHAHPHSAGASAGALSALASSARSRVGHLRATLRRLRAVIAGVERWRAETPAPGLRGLVDEFVGGLRADHALKTRVVEEVADAELGGAVHADRWLAAWTESTPRYARPDAGFVQAFVQAEAELRDFEHASTPGTEPLRASGQGKTLSPALAMLKRRSLGDA